MQQIILWTPFCLKQKGEHKNINQKYIKILNYKKRIGHGIALVKLPSLALKIAREKTVAVEVCPISNQELQYIQDLRNHPASILLAMGVFFLYYFLILIYDSYMYTKIKNDIFYLT